MSTVETLSKRSLEQIARQLHSSIYFLDEYELLISKDYPLIDYSSDLIRTKKACVQLCIRKADDEVQAFKSVFIDCSVYPQLKAISAWTFKLTCAIGLFDSVDDTKAIIIDLLRSIESGEVIAPPSDKKVA